MISIQRIIVGQPFQKHGSKIGVKKFYPIRNLLHQSSKYRNEYNDWMSYLSEPKSLEPITIKFFYDGYS